MHFRPTAGRGQSFRDVERRHRGWTATIGSRAKMAVQVSAGSTVPRIRSTDASAVVAWRTGSSGLVSFGRQSDLQLGSDFGRQASAEVAQFLDRKVVDQRSLCNPLVVGICPRFQVA